MDLGISLNGLFLSLGLDLYCSPTRTWHVTSNPMVVDCFGLLEDEIRGAWMRLHREGTIYVELVRGKLMVMRPSSPSI